MIINPYRFTGGFDQQGKYTEAELDDLITNQNFIPVASAIELNNLRLGGIQTMGVGTQWEGNYSITTSGKYVQIYHIDLSIYSNFPALPTINGGIYDGNLNHITNFNLLNNASGSNALFISLDSTGCLRNVKLSGNVSSTSTGVYHSLLCGFMNNSLSVIEDCEVSGTITAPNGQGVGSICGIQFAGTIERCKSTATINGGRWTGGICGRVDSGSIINNQYSGSITTTQGQVGGVAGELKGGALIEKCFSTGILIANGANYQGGLVGDNLGTINDCYSWMVLNGTSTTKGGFAARNLTPAIITNSYSIGSVSNQTNGGFCYANNSTQTNCYWDIEASGQTASSGAATGKTTTEMQQGLIPDTTIYIGWSALIWDPVNNTSYPILK